MRRLLAVPISAALLAFGSVAEAQNYSFNCITNNSAADCATGEAQFALSVTTDAGLVNFRFTNSGPSASSITDVYFDWASSTYALGQGVLTDSGAGVSFSWGASPQNLPGGNGIGFTADISADSNNPTQPMGVNSGEWLNIAFTTQADFITGLNSGDLRVGIHTQGYAGGGSESLVQAPIPEPETYAMMLVGLTLLGFKARRRIASFKGLRRNRTPSAVAV
jgi:hypothetical protein